MRMNSPQAFKVSDSFDAWTAAHDHVEFYWFPHTDRCLVKHNDRTYDEAQPPGKFANWWEEEFLANTVFGAMCRLGRAAPGYIPILNKVVSKVLSERDYVNDSWLVFTSPRNVRFREMEYALPFSAPSDAQQDSYTHRRPPLAVSLPSRFAQWQVILRWFVSSNGARHWISGISRLRPHGF